VTVTVTVAVTVMLYNRDWRAAKNYLAAGRALFYRDANSNRRRPMNTLDNSIAADATVNARDFLDPQVRRAIRAAPRDYAVEHGLIDSDSEAEVKVVECAPDTLRIAIVRGDDLGGGPLGAGDLRAVSAAGSVSTMSTTSTAGSACTTASSFATANTLACADGGYYRESSGGGGGGGRPRPVGIAE